MSNNIPSALNDVFDEIEDHESRVKEDHQRELRLKNALHSVLSTPQGQIVMRWVLSHCGLNSSLSATDSLRMAVLSGRRDVGLEISNKIRDLCPEQLEQLNKVNE